MALLDTARLAAFVFVAATAIPGAGHSEGDAAQSIRKIELAAVPLEANPDLDGVSAAMLTGAFDAPGLYVARSVMTDGATFPPHAHPDLRMTHVVSGTMYLGEGETFDEAALVAYPAGTVAMTPPGTYHFMAANDGDFTVMEIGAGPSATEFAAD